MNNTKLFIILGNQLFNPHLYFKQINQYDFFLCEDYGLCSYVCLLYTSDAADE